MTYKNIFLTGGSGTLGAELLKINNTIIAPSKYNFNIKNPISKLMKYIKQYNADLFIHAAAYTDQVRAELECDKVRNINIFGTLNIVNLCNILNIPLVFISTSYVFDGKNPPYNTNSPINPINIYSITKAAGELIVKTYSNSMIIRTSFIKNKFLYEKACIDQYTNRDYVDIIAPLIYEACLNFKSNTIIHIGTERKNMFELAKRRKINVEKMNIKNLLHKVPKDVSFKEKNGKFV